MMKNPRNLLIFAVLGGIVGTGLGFALGKLGSDGSVRVNPAELTNIVLAQQEAWNAGDIPGFMDGYWKSEDLRFASGGDVTTGWQATLDRYQARYPNRAAMGELQFDILNVKQMGATHGLVFGRWTLTRNGDAPTGLFTLHLRKMEGEWVIVSDHTSSATP